MNFYVTTNRFSAALNSSTASPSRPESPSSWGHGHNYTLVVHWPVMEPLSSHQPQLLLDACQELVQRLDHRHLGLDWLELEPPITEDILVQYLAQELEEMTHIRPHLVRLEFAQGEWVQTSRQESP